MSARCFTLALLACLSVAGCGSSVPPTLPAQVVKTTLPDVNYVYEARLSDGTRCAIVTSAAIANGITCDWHHPNAGAASNAVEGE